MPSRPGYYYDTIDERKKSVKARYQSLTFEEKKCARLRTTYGISLVQYNELWANQFGKCAICGRELCTERHKPNSPHLDHNHTTGAIRGILCGGCNKGIGLLQDDESVLMKAAMYLAKHKNGTMCIPLAN